MSLVVALGAVSGLRSKNFNQIKALRSPHVVVFYSNSVEGADDALAVVEEVEKRANGYDFYKVDTGLRENGRAARQANVKGGVHVFVMTVEDGVEEFRMELTAKNLARYLRLRGVAGNPHDVRRVKGKRTLFDVIDKEQTPALVRFTEPWCAHCHKMERTWAATATLFKGKVAVLDAVCSDGGEVEALCDELEVDLLPTIYMMAEDRTWVKFDGSRSVAGFEAFLYEEAEMKMAGAKEVESLQAVPADEVPRPPPMSAQEIQAMSDEGIRRQAERRGEAPPSWDEAEEVHVGAGGDPFEGNRDDGSFDAWDDFFDGEDEEEEEEEEEYEVPVRETATRRRLNRDQKEKKAEPTPAPKKKAKKVVVEEEEDEESELAEAKAEVAGLQKKLKSMEKKMKKLEKMMAAMLDIDDDDDE